ncbi:tetratricopeptide repeat protein, partial [bacterium]|nr:tetratricopeptide repeat protein [bacterium]
MKRNLSILIILFVAVIAFPISEFEKYISNAKIYYENGEFDKVISELKEAVQIAEKDNQKGMVEALQYLAFSYVAYDDYEKAEMLFKDIFKIEPEFSLDRDTTSPKILGVYDKAKIGYLQMRADEAKAMKDAAAKKSADEARIQ